MSRDSRMSTISPEMRERQRIMSRMTPEEKKAYIWERYNKKAKPQLLELMDFCQSDHRIFPHNWGKIYSDYVQFSNRRTFTKYPPFKVPLILGASGAPDIEKRQRLLTQIYWCYKNLFMGSMYNSIMKNSEKDWEFGHYQEDKISLEVIKKEYASWLGVKYYPEHDIYNHCANYHKEQKKIDARQRKIERAEEIHNEGNHILDDEGITSIEGM